MNRLALGLITIVTVALSACAKQHYSVRDAHRLELYWNSHEAYVFVTSTRRGWEFTPVEVVTGYARELLGASIPVNRSRPLLTAVWFTSDALDAQTFEGIRGDRFRIVNGTLFLDSQRKWTRARLERSTAGEQQLYDTTPRSPAPEYSNFKGWSYRCCRSLEEPRMSKVPFVLDGVPVDLIVQSERGGQKTFLLKRGEHQTPVLTLNDESRSVSRDEYIQLMGPEGK